MEDLSFLGSMQSMWGFFGLALMLVGKWITVWASAYKKKKNGSSELHKLRREFDEHNKFDRLERSKTEICRAIANMPNEVMYIKSVKSKIDKLGGMTDCVCLKIYNDWLKKHENE